VSTAVNTARNKARTKSLKRHARRQTTLQALPWLAPALVLIGGVVLFPVGFMIYTSFRDLSRFGKDRGWAGLENYVRVFGLDPLPTVLTNTVVWTVGSVLATVLISLGLAQFLNKRFPGRKALRMVIIVPWAASVVMTSTIFVYGLNPYYGIINEFLVDVGILDEPYGFLMTPTTGFLSAMAVAVFVSVPFTTFVILAGLQTVPHDVLEAAQIDGAGRFQTYWQVVFPMLRSALAVAAIINIINVFNSLPILKTMTGSIPGNDADTTTTFMFKLIQNDRQLDTASALSVVNFVVIVVVIAVYLKAVKPMREVSA
jgi:multiple sugar transport system permease protein